MSGLPAKWHPCRAERKITTDTPPATPVDGIRAFLNLSAIPYRDDPDGFTEKATGQVVVSASKALSHARTEALGGAVGWSMSRPRDEKSQLPARTLLARTCTAIRGEPSLHEALKKAIDQVPMAPEPSSPKDRFIRAEALREAARAVVRVMPTDILKPEAHNHVFSALERRFSDAYILEKAAVAHGCLLELAQHGIWLERGRFSARDHSESHKKAMQMAWHLSERVIIEASFAPHDRTPTLEENLLLFSSLRYHASSRNSECSALGTDIFMEHPDLDAETADLVLEMLGTEHSAGINHLRFDWTCATSDLEPGSDQYDKAAENVLTKFSHLMSPAMLRWATKAYVFMQVTYDKEDLVAMGVDPHLAKSISTPDSKSDMSGDDAAPVARLLAFYSHYDAGCLSKALNQLKAARQAPPSGGRDSALRYAERILKMHRHSLDTELRQLDQRPYIWKLQTPLSGLETGTLQKAVQNQIKHLLSKIDKALQAPPAISAAASALTGQSAAPGAAGGPQTKK